MIFFANESGQAFSMILLEKAARAVLDLSGAIDAGAL